MFGLSSFFYRPHYCAECGNEMKGRRGWRQRYLCRECAELLGRRGRLAFVVGGLSLFALVWLARASRDDARRANSPGPPPVSAWDASAKREVKREPEAAETVYCGARTRRGTPCRRLVPPGERCSQHEGQPSIIE